MKYEPPSPASSLTSSMPRICSAIHSCVCAENGDTLQDRFARHTEWIPLVQVASSKTSECLSTLGGGFAVATARHAAAANGKRLCGDEAATIAGKEHRHVGDRIRG